MSTRSGLQVLARVVRFTPMSLAEVRALFAEFAADGVHESQAVDDLAALERGELVALRAQAGHEVEDEGRRVFWPQETHEPVLVPAGDGAEAVLAERAYEAADTASDGLASDLRLNGHPVTAADLARLPVRYERTSG